MSTWAVLQSANGYNSGTFVTATFSGNVGANNKIIAAVSSSWSDVPVTVQDAAVNGLLFCGSSITPSGGSVWLYSMDVPPGDVGTAVAITATWSSTNYQSIVIQEVSGLATGTTQAQVLDYNFGALHGTTANTGSPAYDSTQPGEYLVCIYGDYNTGSALTLTKADGTWTLDPKSVPATGYECALEYKDSSGGSETGGFHGASTQSWAVLMVAFQVAGEALPDPWQFIQSAGNFFFGTAVTATFPNNVAAGNKIIAAVASSWSTAPTTVRDAALNNWTLLGSKATTTGSVWLYALDVPVGDVGIKPAITVTWSGSNAQSIVIQEIAGLLPGNTTAMIDTDTTAVGTLSGTTTATGSPTYSSTVANEYLVCIYGDANGSATPVKQGPSWTMDPANQGNNDSDACIEYGNSIGGAETSGFTAAATAGWSILTVAFKLLPSGTNTAALWAVSQNTTAVAGTGTWTNPGNATGAADTVFATWTAP